MAERGIDVSNETVRCWFLNFSRLIARNLRRSRLRANARWHLDEMVIWIRDRKYWLRRTVDEEGEVLGFLDQRQRCGRSAGRPWMTTPPWATRTKNLCQYPIECRKTLKMTQVNLKLLPWVTGKPLVAQLVAYKPTDITMNAYWGGPARLHLVPHVNAPVADFPVHKMIGGLHFIANLTLPYGQLVHDYLA